MTADDAKISVVIPARNAQATLAETLDSLLAQTRTDWQALIVDNGSTDRTAEIIARYEARDARFRALSGPGEGASAARNIGFAEARGRWLLFLDSDDWIDPRFLELMTAAIASDPAAVAAYCGDRRVMPDGGIAPVRSRSHVAHAPFEAFARSCSVAIHSVLIERECVEKAGGFDPSLRTCEDWDLWQRAARLGGTWIHVDEPLSFYRASPNSLTQNLVQMMADARIVIGRGFAPDPRVQDPAPAYRLGAGATDGDSADLALAYFALWCGAFDCARGGNGALALETFGTLPNKPEQAKMLADLILDGAIVGLRAIPEQMAARWSEFGPATAAMIGRLGDAWGDPSAARRIQYRFERLLLDYDDLQQPRPLGLTLGLRIDLRDPASVTPPAGVDRLYVYLCDGEEILALADIGVLGTFTRRQWIELAISRFGFDWTMQCSGPSLSRARPLYEAAHMMRQAVRNPGSAWTNRRAIRDAAALTAVIRAAGRPATAGSHAARLRQLRIDVGAKIQASIAALTPSKAKAARKGEGADRRSFWESFFEEPDPWNYGSPYEQEKYRRQLEILPDHVAGAVLELACAEGRFTELLAPRVDRLIATDISAKAVERARERCQSQGNIEFGQLDFVADPLPEELDLILCSEVLYYMKDETELGMVAKRFAEALKPGGRFLSAHALLLKDDKSRTGFDWESPFGAKTIARVFAETGGLELERSLQTDLYRVDLFRRRRQGDPDVEPVVETVPIHAEIEPDVARHIIWGGATVRRCEVIGTEKRERMPVLMYHRIADDGPDELARYRVSPGMFRAQMGWLRRNGYHSIGSEQLGWFVTHDHPFVGRPVMISFDDGFQDFADQAWPVLQAHDFTAEMFVVADLVGQSALWDADVGGAAPLMDAATIARLASQGMLFGSHLASHRGGDGLSTQELAEELLRSRAMMGRWLGSSPRSFAPPFGLTDERLRLLAAECGFRFGFSTENAFVSLASDPFDLPRIEVRGDWTIDDFVNCMESYL